MTEEISGKELAEKIKKTCGQKRGEALQECARSVMKKVKKK